MSHDGPNCVARVWDGWRHYACSRLGKSVRDGLPYCGTHDPERVKARQEKRDAESAEKSRLRERARDDYFNSQFRAEVIVRTGVPIEQIVTALGSAKHGCVYSAWLRAIVKEGK